MVGPQRRALRPTCWPRSAPSARRERPTVAARGAARGAVVRPWRPRHKLEPCGSLLDPQSDVPRLSCNCCSDTFNTNTDILENDKLEIMTGTVCFSQLVLSVVRSRGVLTTHELDVSQNGRRERLVWLFLDRCDSPDRPRTAVDLLG